MQQLCQSPYAMAIDYAVLVDVASGKKMSTGEDPLSLDTRAPASLGAHHPCSFSPMGPRGSPSTSARASQHYSAVTGFSSPKDNAS